MQSQGLLQSVATFVTQKLGKHKRFLAWLIKLQSTNKNVATKKMGILTKIRND